MSLPVNIADNSGWFTLNAASASHDKSNPDAPGHGGGGGSGGGSGGSAVGGGGGGGGSGGSSGGAGVGSGGAGNPGSGSAGGGQNSGDAAERDLQEAQLESFVEDESVSGNAAGAPALADALMPNGGQDDMPAVTQIIGATGVTTLDADEELALIAAGWN